MACRGEGQGPGLVPSKSIMLELHARACSSARSLSKGKEGVEGPGRRGENLDTISAIMSTKGPEPTSPRSALARRPVHAQVLYLAILPCLGAAAAFFVVATKLRYRLA